VITGSASFVCGGSSLRAHLRRHQIAATDFMPQLGQPTSLSIVGPHEPAGHGQSRVFCSSEPHRDGGLFGLARPFRIKNIKHPAPGTHQLHSARPPQIPIRQDKEIKATAPPTPYSHPQMQRNYRFPSRSGSDRIRVSYHFSEVAANDPCWDQEPSGASLCPAAKNPRNDTPLRGDHFSLLKFAILRFPKN
jgi:hypothetical protein